MYAVPVSVSRRLIRVRIESLQLSSREMKSSCQIQLIHLLPPVARLARAPHWMPDVVVSLKSKRSTQQSTASRIFLIKNVTLHIMYDLIITTNKISFSY